MRTGKNDKGYWLTPMDLILDSVGKSWGSGFPGFSLDQRQEWIPPVDITETKDSIIVRTELPGLTREDVEIDVANGVLTIRGEKKTEEEDKGRTWHRREVRYGTFSRSFSLPSDVKSEEAKATFSDGILTVALPKEEKAVHRKIEIEG